MLQLCEIKQEMPDDDTAILTNTLAESELNLKCETEDTSQTNSTGYGTELGHLNLPLSGVHLTCRFCYMRFTHEHGLYEHLRCYHHILNSNVFHEHVIIHEHQMRSQRLCQPSYLYDVCNLYDASETKDRLRKEKELRRQSYKEDVQKILYEQCGDDSLEPGTQPVSFTPSFPHMSSHSYTASASPAVLQSLPTVSPQNVLSSTIVSVSSLVSPPFVSASSFVPQSCPSSTPVCTSSSLAQSLPSPTPFSASSPDSKSFPSFTPVSASSSVSQSLPSSPLVSASPFVSMPFPSANHHEQVYPPIVPLNTQMHYPKSPGLPHEQPVRLRPGHPVFIYPSQLTDINSKPSPSLCFKACLKLYFKKKVLMTNTLRGHSKKENVGMLEPAITQSCHEYVEWKFQKQIPKGTVAKWASDTGARLRQTEKQSGADSLEPGLLPVSFTHSFPHMSSHFYTASASPAILQSLPTVSPQNVLSSTTVSVTSLVSPPFVSASSFVPQSCPSSTPVCTSSSLAQSPPSHNPFSASSSDSKSFPSFIPVSASSSVSQSLPFSPLVSTSPFVSQRPSSSHIFPSPSVPQIPPSTCVTTTPSVPQSPPPFPTPSSPPSFTQVRSVTDTPHLPQSPPPFPSYSSQVHSPSVPVSPLPSVLQGSPSPIPQCSTLSNSQGSPPYGPVPSAPLHPAWNLHPAIGLQSTQPQQFPPHQPFLTTMPFPSANHHEQVYPPIVPLNTRMHYPKSPGLPNEQPVRLRPGHPVLIYPSQLTDINSKSLPSLCFKACLKLYFEKKVLMTNTLRGHSRKENVGMLEPTITHSCHEYVEWKFQKQILKRTIAKWTSDTAARLRQTEKELAKKIAFQQATGNGNSY